MNEVRVTGDGSTTLFSQSFRETYHSIFGAITESKVVFIENGLQALCNNPVSVFEVGFGTGLNAYLTCLDAKYNKLNVTYYAIEKFPLEKPILSSLNYPAILATEESDHKIFTALHEAEDADQKIFTALHEAKEADHEIFTALHEAEWEKPVAITGTFTLFKIRADLCTFHPGFHCDVIFFDAFAPDRQPEMWTTEIFRKLYHMLSPGGILVTYCVKGQVKRSLKEAGFRVEKLPGPPGKREILRAWKMIS